MPPTTAPRVLVLDADMSPALAVTRSLGRLGLCVDIAAHEPNTLSAYSRHAHLRLVYPDPLKQRDAFLQWMREHLANDRYPLVFPVTERSVSALLPLLDDEQYKGQIALPRRQSLELALNKERTLSLARQLGIDCPGSCLITEESELAKVPEAFGYPVVIKPARSIGNNGEQAQQLSVAYAQDANELAAKVRHYLLFGEVLVQQYIRGQGIGIELIADHGEIILPFQHKRLHELPLTGGGSSLRESVAIHPGMLAAARELVRAMGWHGVAMVEFKHNPQTDQFSLMEVNGRFWGSLPLSIAAGADFPALLYQLLTQGRIEQLPVIRQGVLARKLSADIYWYELVLRRIGDPAIVTFPGKRQLLRDLLSMLSPRHYLDVQQWRDWKPGLIDLRNILAEQWHRVSGLLQQRKQHREQKKLWQQWVGNGQLKKSRQVLFLCYGNINRSAVAQKILEKTKNKDLRVLSAGFHNKTKRPADPAMIKVASNDGINLSGWASHCVTQEMVNESALVLVMEYSHRNRLLQLFPEAAEKTLLLGMVPGASTGSDEIADPYGKSLEQYSNCYKQVKAYTRQVSSFIHP